MILFFMDRLYDLVKLLLEAEHKKHLYALAKGQVDLYKNGSAPKELVDMMILAKINCVSKDEEKELEKQVMTVYSEVFPEQFKATIVDAIKWYFNKGEEMAGEDLEDGEISPKLQK